MKSHFFSTICLIFLLFVTSQIFAQGVRGNGRVITENRSVGSFDGIIIKGACDIILTEGSNSVKLETDENLQDIVDIYVEDGNLVVKNKESIKKSTEMNLFVSVRELRLLKINGAATLDATDVIQGKELEINVSGAVDGTMEVDVACLNVYCSGAATLNLSGRSGCANYEVDGAATIKAYDLRSDEVEIDVRGTGNAQLYADESLNIKVSGMANIDYKGNPRMTKSMRGMGSVNRKE